MPKSEGIFSPNNMTVHLSILKWILKLKIHFYFHLFITDLLTSPLTTPFGELAPQWFCIHPRSPGGTPTTPPPLPHRPAGVGREAGGTGDAAGPFPGRTEKNKGMEEPGRRRRGAEGRSAAGPPPSRWLPGGGRGCVNLG